jgi:hypothetical protein
MPHPNDDVRTDGTCRVCRDKLSKVIRKEKGKREFRRHLKKNDCSTKGRGEPIR